jgi:hypothetical protein
MSYGTLAVVIGVLFATLFVWKALPFLLDAEQYRRDLRLGDEINSRPD